MTATVGWVKKLLREAIASLEMAALETSDSWRIMAGGVSVCDVYVRDEYGSRYAKDGAAAGTVVVSGLGKGGRDTVFGVEDIRGVTASLHRRKRRALEEAAKQARRQEAWARHHAVEDRVRAAVGPLPLGVDIWHNTNGTWGLKFKVDDISAKDVAHLVGVFRLIVQEPREEKHDGVEAAVEKLRGAAHAPR